VTIPTLPVEPIRAAMQAHDWPLAAALLDEHQLALSLALAAADLTTSPHEPWQALLIAQRSLLNELRAARDSAALELSHLGQNHRGAHAYLQALA